MTTYGSPARPWNRAHTGLLLGLGTGHPQGAPVHFISRKRRSHPERPLDHVTFRGRSFLSPCPLTSLRNVRASLAGALFQVRHRRAIPKSLAGGCPVPSPTSASYPQVACWRVPCSKADAACHPHATSLRLEMYGHPWRAPCNQDGAQLTQGAPVHHLSMMYGRPLQAPISCTGAASAPLRLPLPADNACALSACASRKLARPATLHPLRAPFSPV